MIKLTKQVTFTPIFINHSFIVSIEDVPNGSKVNFQTGAPILVKQTALEILELIKQL
jgi:uncharacterized protein YlzI (FlbEa/FlbD family)